MKYIELWLPSFWIKPIFENDFSELTEDQQYMVMNFIDQRFLIHEKFTPVSYDQTSADRMVIHDAMHVIKAESLECVRAKFAVDRVWYPKAVQSV